jgi:hypothetical protein
MLRNIFARLGRAEQAPPERRREDRHGMTGGTVEIDGQSYPVENWSYTGFLASSYAGPRKAGDRVDIKFTADAGGRSIGFACAAMMVRVDAASRKVVGAFVDMDAGTRAKLARHVDQSSSQSPQEKA